MSLEFTAFPKIARHRRSIVITEKIDGTNAQIAIDEEGRIQAGSRSRWITPDSDNYGFAAWVRDNAEVLRTLGPGVHFGEWWGLGIQRRYGLTEKRFSLFNAGRWGDPAKRPACCHVVPVLYAGANSDEAIDGCLRELRERGSIAAPGFMRPEGIVIFHGASRMLSKITLEKDDEPKGKEAAE